MTITRNFKLYLNAGTASAPYINVNQYDEGEEWVFTLYNEDGSTYTPSSGAIIGIKSDGNAIMNAGSVVGGKVVITETEQMTAASGRAIFELLIDNATHGTANFIVNVERRPSDDAEFSDSDLSMLQEAIDAAEVINEILDEGGDPSEIIAENVDAWLDAHPEATTTVEDGAITAPKINNSLWDKILVNEEVSGNPASFEDGADDVPVSSLRVALEPIQTGSGDPSPTNIRPISGHSSVTVQRTGKNLLQTLATTQTINGVTFTVNNDGTVSLSGTSTDRANFSMPLSTSLADGNYILSGCPSGGSGTTYYQQAYASGSGRGVDTGDGVAVVGPASEITRIVITVRNAGINTDGLVFKPMVRLASETDATYEPYIGTSYPYSLGQDVYGGSVDLATGVLTVDKVAVDLGTFTWTAQSDAQGQYFRTGLTPQGRVSLTENICTCYAVVSSTNVGDGNIAMGAIGNVMYVRDTRFTDAATFKTGITGQMFVYLLATPQTIQMTPQEVKTLLGYNNISSSGTVDVIYHADTKLYIDKRIAELG